MITSIGHTIFSVLLLVIVGSQGVFASGEGKQATFSLVPSLGNYKTKEEFTVQLQLNTTKAVTSLQAYLTFDSSLLSVTKIDSNTTSFPYWWESKSESGMIKLLASVPAPGVLGQATVAAVTMKVLRPGIATLRYDPSSLVLTPEDQNILDRDSSSEARFVVSESPGGPPWPLILGALGIIGIIILILIRRKLRGGDQV